jgi:soluble lytic murein transglycosylase-like protein
MPAVGPQSGPRAHVAGSLPLALAAGTDDGAEAAGKATGTAAAALPSWAVGLPAAGRRWAPAIEDAARREGLDPVFLAAVVWVESSFDPHAYSSEGAIGLAQLLPATAAEVRVDPWKPAPNLVGGARYLRKNLLRFGRTDLALAAYNAGPARVVDAAGLPPIAETVEYVDRVLEAQRHLTEAQMRNAASSA